MNNFIYLLVLMGISVFSSCKNETECCTNRDLHMDFSIMSNEGVDLLDQNENDAIEIENIKLDYFDSQMNKISNDLVSNFYHLQEETIFFVRIYAAEIANQTIIVRWGDVDLDTLKCELEISDNSSIIERIVLNNEELWRRGMGERHFELIK